MGYIRASLNLFQSRQYCSQCKSHRGIYIYTPRGENPRVRFSAKKPFIRVKSTGLAPSCRRRSTTRGRSAGPRQPRPGRRTIREIFPSSVAAAATMNSTLYGKPSRRRQRGGGGFHPIQIQLMPAVHTRRRRIARSADY